MLHVRPFAPPTHSRNSFSLLFRLALLVGGPVGCSGTDFGSTGPYDSGPMDATTEESPPAAIYIPTDGGHNDGGVIEASMDGGGPCADADATCAVASNLPDADASPGTAPLDAAEAGVSCVDGSTPCDGGCVPRDDLHNCGACGNACATSVPNAQPTCMTGVCAVSCNDSTKTLCGNACVSTQSDANNCGACGHVCAPGACSGGRCQPWLIASSTVPVSVVSDGVYVAWVDTGTNQCFAEAATTVNTTPWAFAKGTSTGTGLVGAVALSSGTIACVLAGTGGNEIYFGPEGSGGAAGERPVPS